MIPMMTWKQLKELVDSFLKENGKTDDIPIDYIDITAPLFYKDPSDKARYCGVEVFCDDELTIHD